MMNVDSSIVVAIITGIITLIGTIVTVITTNRQTVAALSEQSKIADEKINSRIGIIETKVDTLSDQVKKHNSLIERMYKVEERVSILEKK